MQLTSVPQVDVASLRGQFTSLAVDLSRTDAKLEDNERARRRPTSGWDTTMEDFAVRLDSARIQLLQVRPDARDVVHRLGVDTRHVAWLGGKLETYQANGLGFGHGWGSALDTTISDVRRAADLLDQTPLPPVTPPVPPVTPPTTGTGEVVRDAASAVKLVRRSLETIRSLPSDDTGTDSTKDARLAAYNLNTDAQKLIEPHFASRDQFVVSQLRAADARLEDANWQLAKKPSPDGRFNGVDIPGATRDTDAAVATLEKLVSALATGS